MSDHYTQFVGGKAVAQRTIDCLEKYRSPVQTKYRLEAYATLRRRVVAVGQKLGSVSDPGRSGFPSATMPTRLPAARSDCLSRPHSLGRLKRANKQRATIAGSNQDRTFKHLAVGPDHGGQNPTKVSFPKIETRVW